MKTKALFLFSRYWLLSLLGYWQVKSFLDAGY
ncbi:MAG: hypothetical protein ACI9E1_002252, partial [Cryomorphaceae bacterium]